MHINAYMRICTYETRNTFPLKCGQLRFYIVYVYVHIHTYLHVYICIEKNACISIYTHTRDIHTYIGTYTHSSSPQELKLPQPSSRSCMLDAHLLVHRHYLSLQRWNWRGKPLQRRCWRKKAGTRLISWMATTVWHHRVIRQIIVRQVLSLWAVCMPCR
jgi:hypothetical protein